MYVYVCMEKLYICNSISARRSRARWFYSHIICMESIYVSAGHIAFTLSDAALRVGFIHIYKYCLMSFIVLHLRYSRVSWV